MFRISKSNTLTASDENTFTVTTYDYLHKRPWMSGLSNKGSYVRARCMNSVTDYRFIKKNMDIQWFLQFSCPIERRYDSERNVSKKCGSIFLFLSVVFFYIDSILFVTSLKNTLYGRTSRISVGSVSACQGVADLIETTFFKYTPPHQTYGFAETDTVAPFVSSRYNRPSSYERHVSQTVFLN